MEQDVKKNVREAYGRVAREGSSCCGSSNSCCSSSDSCCGNAEHNESASKLIGYTDAELAVIPEGADMGLGCGNPVALASLKEGEVVLDLGSGPGMDCFLAAARVGRTGKVIGVDMTPDMLDLARKNAAKGDYSNVEFRMGEIENLPVANNFVDVVISNCVINLSPDKPRVFSEIYRVLRPGGRLMVSDIVLEQELPESVKQSEEAYCSCIAGAALKNDYLKIIRAAKFKNIKIVDQTISYIQPSDFQPETEPNPDQQCNCNCNCNCQESEAAVISIRVSATKPKK
jgi:SAM-dependent methyltransferase